MDAKIAAKRWIRQARLRLVRNRLAEISIHLQNELSDTDWAPKREIIRALVQRIEIGQKESRSCPPPANRHCVCARPSYSHIVTGVNTPLNAIWSG